MEASVVLDKREVSLTTRHTFLSLRLAVWCEGWSAVARAMTRHQNNEQRVGRRFLIEKSGLTAHSCEECISADVGGEDEDGWEGILDSNG